MSSDHELSFEVIQHNHAMMASGDNMGAYVQASQDIDRWLSAEIAAAEKRGAEQAIRDAAERVKRTFTGETHYETLREHADMIRDDEVDWRKPIDRIEESE